MNPSDSHSSLSRVSLTLLVIASMIGAGVYTTSGFALADLGSPGWVIMAWIIGGAIAIGGAIGYGQLAGVLCDNGGEYLYLSRFVHPAAGFIAGWVSLLAGFTGAGAFAALAFESYAMTDTVASQGFPTSTLAIGLIAACTCLHCLPMRRGVWGQNVLVACKLFALAACLVIAFSLWNRWASPTGPSTMMATLKSGPPSWLALGTSVMWISLSYSGFNAAIYVAGDSRGGHRSVAMSMLTATIVVTALYILLNAVFMYGPPTAAAIGQKDIAAVAANSLGGPNLSALVRVAICLGLASSVSSVLVAGPRVYAKMARDGVFPRWLDSPESPRRLVVAQGIGMILLVAVAELRELLSYLSLTLALSGAATVATLFWMRTERSRIHWASKLAALVYLVGTLLTAGLTAWNRPVEAQAAAWTIASGLLTYLVLHWWRGGKVIAT